MENQHLNTATGVESSHSPKIVAAAGDALKEVVVRADVGAWHHRPRAPVPMEGKGVEIGSGIDVNAHSPNVVAAAGHCVNAILGRVNVGAWHLGPRASVPMYCKAVPGEELPIRVLAPRPHVVAAAGHSIKYVSTRAWTGGYHLGPRTAIPVQRKRPAWLAAGIIVHSHRPHVVAVPCSSVNVIVIRARIRTWHQRPSAPVPMYRQRPKAARSK
jgi:hypothetical protein